MEICCTKMNEDKLKDKIELAKKIVSNQPDPYKIEAFKVILNYLILSDHEVTINPKSIITQHEKQDPIKTGDTINKFANSCGITVEQLTDIISIKENKFELVVPINEKNDSQKMIKGALCIMITYEQIFGVDWMKTQQLTQHLREIGIQDHGYNLSTYLKQNPDLFRARGSGKGTEYKLTTGIGRTKAYETIKELAAGSKNNQ
jgi:hypothetical protein